MNSYGDGNTYRGKVCKDSETPTIITDGKTAYNREDYPVHSSGPWSVTAGIAPDPKGRLIVEDCSVCGWAGGGDGDMSASARGRSRNAKPNDFWLAFDLCLNGRMTKQQALIMAKGFSRRGRPDASEGCLHYTMALMAGRAA